MKVIKYISVATIILLTMGQMSCKRESTGLAQSNVARITAFRFAAQDSFPGLAAAKFIVEELNDTGVIRNADSIKYGTRLTKVVPSINYYTSPSAVYIKWGKDSTYWFTGRDTIDFSKIPMSITVVSEDGSKTKTYKFDITIHQVDPDLMDWQIQNDQIYSAAANEQQQLLAFNDKLWLYSSDGTQTALRYSTDKGETWFSGAANTPKADCNVKNIFTLGNRMYYVDGKDLYTSTDGEAWISETLSLDIDTMTYLFSWEDRAVLSGLRPDKKMCVLMLNDGLVTDKNIKLDDNFPRKEFAAAAFQSASLRKRAIVMGGRDKNNNILNSCWSFEYTVSSDTVRIQNYATGRNMPKISATAIVYYYNSLMRFGGINESGQLDSAIYVSTTEGITWQVADSASNQLPDEFGKRQKINALVYDNDVYLFGGQTANELKTDIWKGRINSIDWIK